MGGARHHPAYYLVPVRAAVLGDSDEEDWVGIDNSCRAHVWMKKN